MSSLVRTGPDRALVVAAQRGDRPALDALLRQCSPLVYNIVGRALDGHADTDDVVQETLLRMVRHLPDLRDPAAFRSWLVAIALRGVRDCDRDRRATQHRQTDLADGQLVPDPASDFTELTILRLGLSDQRREVAEATRWLDTDDRALLSVWWLEETGELARSDVARALGVSAPHTAVRVRRMKQQVKVARTVVRALAARPSCRELGELARRWDGHPNPLWRKRLARHIRDCRACRGTTGGLLPIDRLLAGLPLVPVPAALGALGGSFSPPSGGTGPAPPGHQPGYRHRSRPRAHHRATGHAFSPAAAPGPFAAAVAVAAVTAAVIVHASADPGARTTLSAVRPAPVTASRRPAVPTPSRSPTHPVASRPPVTPSARPAPPRIVRPSAPPLVAAPPARPASSTRKGVSAWSFSGGDQALAASGASWYYTWSITHAGLTTPAGVGFVPMIWGRASVTSSALAQARTSGPELLTFNEPDRSDQANLTPAVALSLWPQLMATGMTLGSPAVSAGAADPGGWLDQFMAGAAGRNYRVDFITLHWYGSDFTTAAATEQLRSYLQAVYDRYHRPIWLTEYALINFSGGASHFPSDAQQAAFVTSSTQMLDGLPYLARYAWFALPASDTGPSTGLYRSGAQVTAAGRAFAVAR